MVAFSAKDLMELDYQQAKKQVMTAFSSAYLNRRLEGSHGNVTEAARQSGMLRPNFSKLMKRFGVSRSGARHRPEDPLPGEAPRQQPAGSQEPPP